MDKKTEALLKNCLKFIDTEPKYSPEKKHEFQKIVECAAELKLLQQAIWIGYLAGMDYNRRDQCMK